MNTSPEGVKLIAEFEGFSSTPYNDPVGHATIGYGHLIHHGNVTSADRRQWGTLSNQEGLNLLKRDLVKYETPVRQYVKVPLTQPQFDALVSFTYNLGPNALKNSTLLRKLNARDYAGAADEFLKWNKAGGRQLEGLTRRRKAERAMFVRGSQQTLTKREEAYIKKYKYHKARSGKKNLNWTRFYGAWLAADARLIRSLARNQKGGWALHNRGVRYQIIAKTLGWKV